MVVVCHRWCWCCACYLSVKGFIGLYFFRTEGSCFFSAWLAAVLVVSAAAVRRRGCVVPVFEAPSARRDSGNFPGELPRQQR